MISPTHTAIEQRHLRIDSATVYYEVAGSGPPLVLVHGLSGSSRWWRYNVAALAQQFQVHVIDLIGFGRSRRQPFVLQQAATLLAAWLNQLGLERASLVGHSMGGYIIADLAARFPQSVDRLVLVDAAALPFRRGYVRNALGLLLAARYVPLNFFPVLLTDTLQAGPVTVFKAMREILAADLTGDLRRIMAPALVVWGEHDTVIPRTVGEALARELPNARLRVIDGAGHNPMWDRPAQFNQVVLEFLAAEPTVAPAREERR